MSETLVSAYRRHPLDAIFAPKTVAVIGATEKEGAVGRTILWNLISHPFGGTVFPVNPNRSSVLGIHAYPKIADVPAQVDLAVIVTPALTVPGIIEECVEAGVKGAIIISAGFKEIGKAGAQLEQKILRRAQSAKMRIIGPNCLGVMSPVTGLNATFARGMARPGNVAFISQSGALCTSVLDWSFRENVGFSHFVSIGSMLDVDWGDLIYYLGDDSRTKSIVLYMETIGDARSFLSAAREVSLSKPIIVIKAGRTAAAAKAAASHTGSLAGSDAVLDAAFRRCGVLRVDYLSHLFAMAEVLDKQPHPRGRKLTIVTNAGGPGVLATDALIQGGGELAELSDETMAALNEALPRHWSHGNPIDILGDATPERYTEAVKIAADDPNSDGLLVILTPQDMTYPTQTAEQMSRVLANTRKPVLASWMGGPEVAAGVDVLNRANIPTFDYPDTACHIFNYMWRYTYNLRSIYETPSLPIASEAEATNQRRATELIEEVRKKGRTILTEYESKQIFQAYGIPTVPTLLAHSPDEAVARAEEIGYPVVLKLNSETITHKSDVNGVQLNLTNADEVRQAYERIRQTVTERKGAEHFQGVTVQPMEKLDGYELIIGSSQDSQFGPVLLFGTGGTLVEVFQDRALGLPPLNTTLARRMMEQTKIFQALQGVRGRGRVDLEALERLLVRFSQLVVEQPRIREIDINPLFASPERLVALDARIVLHDPDLPDEELPRPAIRPYPVQYTWHWQLPDGSQVEIRPIRPEDEPLMVEFTQGLSPDSLYLRYFHAVSVSSLIAHEQLARLCFVDYDREMALVAVRTNPESGKPEILAHGQLTKLHGTNDAEFSIQVRDDFQGTGLGTELLSRLLEIGRHEKLERVVAEILPENTGMRRVCTKLGFKLQTNPETHTVQAEIHL
ncbi:bifunctional acetate--CoA ligase family protein/GNAT family N-acetyltransferase [Litorilinea aerophila]|nr:bifunctional acetate--CoA ligase family protein/GNAT family N-acetyltransferase [Litorilinea aerophila]MCC9076489.1 bifunctional acetate--CoA ligase family protein/GNAT family N-acetyltransferase [Litorilinea aerophila]GIV79603.1 MAG: GNAT family N-acetyltransferase [Litorilinea sp.]